jgi:hypothetical protein
LWRGIGAFVAKNPQYRTLYGTVSISKLYDPRSVKLIEDILIKQDNKKGVQARHQFAFNTHNEIAHLASQQDLQKDLSAMLESIEDDGKDIPILAKQYLKMGAKFQLWVLIPALITRRVYCLVCTCLARLKSC